MIFQIIIIFSDWILIKQIIVSATPSAVGGNRLSNKSCLAGMGNFPLPGSDCKNLQESLDWAGGHG